MSLTVKGKMALQYIQQFCPTDKFTASSLSAMCGDKVAAASLVSLANQGFIIKLGGTPAEYQASPDLKELLVATSESEKSKANSDNLRLAKKTKNDEFYTQFKDIEVEVMKYRKQLQDKIIYLPCDDPAGKKSNFWEFFVLNFDAFGLKKLIATHYDENGKAYKIWIDGDTTGDGYVDEGDAQQEDLEGNGDFRSPECTAILNECDIVITNPPFSLFREFVPWILSAKKDFLIIGNQNAFGYKEIFKLFQNNQIWTGYNKVKEFLQPDGTTKKFGNICWFTNLMTHKRNEELILVKKYNPIDYPKYDNYDAIEVNKVVNIPQDYDGIIGVPISFLEKYNPNQFEILGNSRYHDGSTVANDINFINGKQLYTRILIRKK